MARYFLGEVNEQKESKEHGGAIGGGIEAGQDKYKPGLLKTPPMFGGQYVPIKPGGIAFGLVGHGFWHIGPGEFVDLPDTVSPEVVKSMAPQLLSKDEAIKQGLCHEDGSLKAQKRAPRQIEAPVK